MRARQWAGCATPEVGDAPVGREAGEAGKAREARVPTGASGRVSVQSRPYMGKRAFGVCMGASTITAVELAGGGPTSTVTRIVRRAHDGNPQAVLPAIVEELGCDGAPILVTGRKLRTLVRLPSITEPEAVEHALAHVARDGERWDAVVSAGGETFMAYVLDARHRIVGISTGNKCASGTGEFFLQQIRRMDLDVEAAVALAAQGKPYVVSGRCSVFAKSDCTHALNKGEPITDVTAGLCEMISDKIYELLATVPHGRVLVTGGVALNSVVMGSLRRRLASVTVPEQAAYFEALGAGLAAFERGAPRPVELFDTERSSFGFLPPLKEAESLVTFNTISYSKPVAGDACVVGLDVGSSARSTCAPTATPSRLRVPALPACSSSSTAPGSRSPASASRGAAARSRGSLP